MRRVSTRTVVLVGLFVALVMAGFVSYYASSDPDGLNRVAQDKGLSGSEKDHAAEDGPLAGYETKGVDDGRVSGGLAGVVGAVVVLGATGGIAYAVRRRPADKS
jgi:cobalt/nickel transport system permease protein/cobalt/nickel transport protein